MVYLEAAVISHSNLCGLARYLMPRYFSGNAMHFQPTQMNQTDKNFDEHLCSSLITNIKQGYSSYTLTQQYRSIPTITNLVSSIFCDTKMQSHVEIASCDTAKIVREVMTERYGIKQPIAYLDLPSDVQRLGRTRTKLNQPEVSIALKCRMDFVCLSTSYTYRLHHSSLFCSNSIFFSACHTRTHFEYFHVHTYLLMLSFHYFSRTFPAISTSPCLHTL